MRRSTFIVCIAVIAALAAGIAILSLWPDSGSEPPVPSPPSIDSAELIREAVENVAGIYFRPRGGTPYTLRRDPSGGEIELDAPDALFPGRASAMRLTFNSAIGLSNLTRVTEEADDTQLALFGLDDPVMIWRVNRADGTSAEFMVGAEQPAGRGRYARRHGSREVFLLTALQSSNLTQTLESIYDLSFFPYPPSTGEEPTWNAVEHLILETGGGTIELRRRSQEEMAGAEIGTSLYRILQPFESEANDLVQVILLENVTRIAPDSIEELSPSDLSVYGLDSPDRLTVASGDWSGTLLIGRRSVERDGRYVMMEGIDAVLFDPDNSNYSFLSVEPTQLRQGIIWLNSIDTISSVTFDLEGVTRVLRLEHNFEEESLQGWLDDRDIGETNARRLYLAALRLAQSGGTDAGIPAGPPAYRVTIRFLDGGEETLELYRLTESEFLIVHDGVNTGLFMTRMILQQHFLSRFEILDRGEDIPR